MPCTGHLFQPLENVIREKLIPALVRRSVSDIERRILALPVRFGGIGLINPVLSALFSSVDSPSQAKKFLLQLVLFFNKCRQW